MKGWRQRAVSRSLSAARTRAERRVQRFLDAAFELIDETGTSEFTIQEVVDRSKQSLRGFYQYFDGKDELLFALLEENIRESIEDLRAAVESETRPLERLRAFTIRLHEWCEPLGTRRKRGAHNRVPISAFSLQLAVKDPERLATVTAPISRMLIELLDAAVAADTRSGGRYAACRAAHPADRDVQLADESPGREDAGERHGRGGLASSVSTASGADGEASPGENRVLRLRELTLRSRARPSTIIKPGR